MLDQAQSQHQSQRNQLKIENRRLRVRSRSLYGRRFGGGDCEDVLVSLAGRSVVIFGHALVSGKLC